MAKTNKAKTSKNAPARSTKYHSKVASKASAKKASAKTASAKKSTKTKVDPITLSVIRGILETTQREMTLSLEKTARSSVFNLAHDYSTALFNHVPEMILQGQDIPIHLGSLIPAMKSVARYFGDDIHEGDLILHNDPAFGGSHAIDSACSSSTQAVASACTALAAGEIVSTGTLTKAMPVAAGEVWTATPTGIALDAIRVRFS